jgi:TPR repeat protein
MAALLYAMGLENPRPRRDHFKKAARAGLAEAHVACALSSDWNSSLEDARRFSNAAADQGHPTGHFLSGVLLAAESLNVPDAEKATLEEKAFGHFLQSAEKGNALGESAVAACKAFGFGTSENESEALDYAERSAQKGDLGGDLLSGFILKKFGGDENHCRAAQYFKRAAERQCGFAKAAYAWILENGQGVAQDTGTACEFYKDAVKGGFKEGQTAADRCCK